MSPWYWLKRCAIGNGISLPAAWPGLDPENLQQRKSALIWDVWLANGEASTCGGGWSERRCW